MSEDPPPTSDLDADLSGFLGTSRKTLWSIVIIQGVLLVLVAMLSGYLGLRQLDERARVEHIVAQFESSQCSFYSLLGSIPPDPKTTSRLGVTLVENSRVIVHALGCARKLPPPGAALIRLGAKYGVKITY
jgi:hypothetical protein